MLRVVDYAEVKTTFFQPRTEATTSPPLQTPARRLRDAIEPIATISFWSEPSYERYAALGLDFFGGYVLSRGCPLGEASPYVVAAAFAVFEPGVVAGLYSQALATTTVQAMRIARLEGAVVALEQVAESQSDLVELVSVLRNACDLAQVMGRPIYAGLAALEWPEEPLGQLWHACTMLREYRGDGHIAACVSHGLDAIEANILTELRVGWELGAYTATRGWSSDAIVEATERLSRRGLVSGGSLTEQGVVFRDEIEKATDESVALVVQALGDDLDSVVTQAEQWSKLIIQHGWFPPDPYKRAAG